MTIQQKIHTTKFKDILKINRVRKISLFGSYAQGLERKNSDLDFLVDFGRLGQNFVQIKLADNVADRGLGDLVDGRSDILNGN